MVPAEEILGHISCDEQQHRRFGHQIPEVENTNLLTRNLDCSNYADQPPTQMFQQRKAHGRIPEKLPGHLRQQNTLQRNTPHRSSLDAGDHSKYIQQTTNSNLNRSSLTGAPSLVNDIMSNGLSRQTKKNTTDLSSLSNAPSLSAGK